MGGALLVHLYQPKNNKENRKPLPVTAKKTANLPTETFRISIVGTQVNIQWFIIGYY